MRGRGVVSVSIALAKSLRSGIYFGLDQVDDNAMPIAISSIIAS